MNKRSKKITAILLAITLAFSFAIESFAAKEAVASVPVKLTVVNTYKSISVTVPASFPIEVYNGKVITADNAKITNNSDSGSIKITGINIKKGAFDIGNYNNFENTKNSIALKINGVSTEKAGNLSVNESAFPIINSQKSLDLKYYAKVSGNVDTMNEKEIAQVVITIAVAE